jgi:hypothetical protein
MDEFRIADFEMRGFRCQVSGVRKEKQRIQ